MFRQIFYKRRKFYDDDFDWDNYTRDSYHRRLKGDVERHYRAVSRAGDLNFDAATGAVVSNGAAIHPNQGLILEAIGQLRPESVHEVGCGGGDHLASGMALFGQVNFTGGDRGRDQLALAVQRHPQLAGRVALQDVTMPFSHRWPAADLVYTQAVIMHIHTAVSHFVALTNMVRMARKQVLLVENPQCHNLVRDVTGLAYGGHFDWSDLYMYRFEGTAGARAMLLSKTPLDYPALRDDTELRRDIKPSPRRLSRADDDSARALFGFDRA
ncbi:MAG: class I SAM-dependent methyltransferase [Rhodobacteraceae bacterium]|nr:class I SAM-dependent methyltransferase [Paracoccaceae bacterium]